MPTLPPTIAGIPTLPLVGGVVVIGGLLYWRHQQAAQSAAAASAAAAQGASSSSSGSGLDPSLLAYQAGEASGVSSYSSGVDTGITLVQSILGNFPPESVGGTGGGGSPVPAPAPAPAPSPTPTPKEPGKGIVSTKLGPMIWLGTVGTGSYYNVGGGAPVYFGNTQTLSQGLTNDKNGQEIYTPQQYASLVAATPVSTPFPAH